MYVGMAVIPPGTETTGSPIFLSMSRFGAAVKGFATSERPERLLYNIAEILQNLLAYRFASG
jgi:hypothetical protein